MSSPPTPPLAPLDPTLPLSHLLKSATSSVHTTAETSPGAAALAAGTLPVEEYVRYLYCLWRVYGTLEEGLERNKENPVLKGIYNPALLSRKESLEQDITYLLTLLLPPSTSPFSLPSDSLPLPPSLHPTPFPLPPFLRTLHLAPPKQLTAFTHRLETLASSDPALLLAHAYVRYLGDLSGGQFVAAKIRRTYSLPSSGEGTRFYHFDLDGIGAGGSGEGEKVAEEGESRAERKRRAEEVKRWFKEGMDGGVEGDEGGVKLAIVQEAILCFQLSTGLFSLLRPPPSVTPTPSVSEKQPPWLHPSAPTVLYDATSSAPGTQKTLGWFIAFLLAVGVTHFVLTTAGVSAEEVGGLLVQLGRKVWEGEYAGPGCEKGKGGK